MTPRVTIKTIAEEVGVTHGTVSRALRGDSRVRARTAQAVLEVAERLGYRPSRLGRALKTQTTGSLAIVVSYVHDPFYSEVVQAVHDRLFPLERSLFMAATEHDLERQRSVARTLAEQLVDGVFVCCVPGMTPPFQQLSQTLPTVTINCDPAIYSYGVVHDDANAVRQSLDHLVRFGHRRIAYLGADTGGYAQRIRLRTFLEASAELGLSGGHRLSPDIKIESGEQAMREWLSEGGSTRPSAVLCFNDTIAIGAVKACRDWGLSVPEDISVIGFDDIEMAQYLTPGLTTFRQPRYDMGRAATEMMMALLSGKHLKGPQIFLGHLVERGTVASAI